MTSDAWKSKPRRFIQYNDLVFKGTRSINGTPSETITTKYGSTEYLLRHGSYVTAQDTQLLIKEDKISLDLAIETTNWDLETVKAHVDFIKEQLITRGKLWAIDTGGTLIWANVLLDSYTPTYEWTYRDDGAICFQVEFNNYSGVWHKADGNTTFLLPYELCSWTSMLANCFYNSDCDNCENTAWVERGFCENCALQCCELGDAEPLCSLRGDIEESFFSQCDSVYRVVHNCELGRNMLGSEKLWGQAFCDTCIEDIFTTKFYADTVLKSRNITVTLYGEFENPEITINDTKVKLEGKFTKGYLSVSSDGRIYEIEQAVELQCEPTEISNTVLTLCDGKWWTVEKGFNQLIVQGITSSHFCAFINYERLTY